MTRHHLEISCVPGHDIDKTRASFPTLIERITDALDTVTGVEDLDLGANLRTQQLDFTMDVDADTPGEALDSALTAVRTVLHTAGAATPGWEKAQFEAVEQTVRPESSVPV